MWRITEDISEPELPLIVNFLGRRDYWTKSILSTWGRWSATNMMLCYHLVTWKANSSNVFSSLKIYRSQPLADAWKWAWTCPIKRCQLSVWQCSRRRVLWKWWDEPGWWKCYMKWATRSFSEMNSQFHKEDLKYMGGHQKVWKLYEQSDLIVLAASSWPHSPTIIIMDCLAPIRHFKTKAFIKFLSNVKYAYTYNTHKRKRLHHMLR